MFYQTVQLDLLADLPSRGVSSTVMLSRQSHGKRKDEEKLPQTKNVATVDDFEEAREVMSGENSNLPVKRSFRESIQGKYRNGRSNKIRDFKVRPCLRSKFPRNIQSRRKVGFFDLAGDTFNFAARIIIIS